ncbi:MAG TPA: MurR/RpiR family transcriptional regulator [Firmicutes bacterium]|nr:MurR/RpiR family transcriptional regulator [Bacillota bacterium]
MKESDKGRPAPGSPAMIDQLLWQNQQQSVYQHIASQLGTERGKARELARFLLENPEGIHLSAKEIAERCDTNPSTLLRLCRRLGYRNFTELKAEMQRAAGRECDDGREEAAGRLKTPVYQVTKKCLMMILDTFGTIDCRKVEQAVTAILAAPAIVVFGAGLSAGIGKIMHIRLRKHSLPSQFTSDAEEALTSLSSGSNLLFCISYMAVNPTVVRLLTQTKRKGVPSILLTNLPGASAGRYADITITTNVTSIKTDGYDVLCRSSQLLVIALLDELLAAARAEALPPP